MRPEKTSTKGLSRYYSRLSLFPAREVALCALAIIMMSIFFVIRYDVTFWLVACSIPFAFLAGYTIFFLERLAATLHRRIVVRNGRIQAGFLAFFLYLLLGIMVLLFMVSYPLGLLAGWLGSGYFGADYGRWAVNLGIVIALICWLRSVLRNLTISSG